ncbi:DUF2809 domain-containing protein [Desulfofustis limnaeus]|uniref:DUF2809 domain-containing protein n=1 Tax=Desulfofustis limnaeus TaxID=2740163 RepID=A0ABN6M242_9BACT|nr:DUF2809 domain-containing protein [Desulfofustis limnaeus]BDD86064.1 hypothetical protein DPPLL_04290 [Desulfofustis limnaeus]
MQSENGDSRTTVSGVPAKEPRKERTELLKFLVICLPLWFSAALYRGPYDTEVNHYLAGILYLMCWALVIQFILPRLSERPLLLALFLFFCLVELVAWRFPALLSGLSMTVAERTIIGGHFSLNKIPYYGVGAFTAFFLLRACRRS